MEYTDLQTRKLRLIERFTRIDSAELLAGMEELLMEAELEEREKALPELTGRQKKMLDEAYQQYLDNPSSARPLDEVEQDILSKYE